MTHLLLTDTERDRFATYLEQEAETDRGILEQMEKIQAPGVITQKVRIEMMAARVIAQKLRSTESMTVGGEKE